MSANLTYTTNLDDYLVIRITGEIQKYIAQVVRSEPLILKVTESGLYSKLKFGDFTIDDEDSAILQQDDRDGTNILLNREYKAGRSIASGLKSLGVNDEDDIYKILPDPIE